VTWNRIEGSDANESVRYEGSENLVTQYGLDHRYSNDTLNLRGGDNGVSYTAIETSITVDISVVEDTGTGDGIITSVIDFQDGNSAPLDNDGAQHTVTSYGADNSIAGGTLKIEASQDAEDTVSFNTDSDKVFLLGVSAGVLNVDIGTENSMILTGFEILIDADSDDVYDMADLETVQLGMELRDNGTNDRDTIKVGDDAVAYDGGPAVLTAAADTISLEVLNDVFGFDFDVLDITNVTENNLLLVADDDNQDGVAPTNSTDTDYVGPGDVDGDGDLDVARELIQDDVVVGDLDLIDSVTGFDSIYFTNASITSAGTEFVLDVTGSQLEDDSAALFALDSTSMNFSRVTGSNLTLSAISAAAVEIVGGAGNDDITGGAGNDTLEGGAGNDTLDGGIATEVQSIDLSGAVDAVAAAGNRVSFDWLGQGNLTLAEAAAADTDYTDGAGAVVDGAGTSVIGAELAALLNSNLTQVNADWQTAYVAPTEVITGVTFNAGVLSFTFASGVNVANLADLGVAFGATPDAGTFVVSATSEVTAGNDGGNDTFVFADSAANNGVDTINGFQAGADELDFTNLEGDSNSHDVAADAAAQGMHGDGEVYVFADGADGTGAEAITNYTNAADVAAFLAAAFNDESAFDLLAGDGWISAVINDLLTDTAYVYDVRVGDDDILDAGSVTLIGIVNADAALTTGDIVN